MYIILRYHHDICRILGFDNTNYPSIRHAHQRPERQTSFTCLRPWLPYRLVVAPGRSDSSATLTRPVANARRVTNHWWQLVFRETAAPTTSRPAFDTVAMVAPNELVKQMPMREIHYSKFSPAYPALTRNASPLVGGIITYFALLRVRKVRSLPFCSFCCHLRLEERCFSKVSLVLMMILGVRIRFQECCVSLVLAIQETLFT